MNDRIKYIRLMFNKLLYLVKVQWKQYTFFHIKDTLFVAVLKRSFRLITKQIRHGNIRELLWTIIPTLILIILAIPSVKLLFSTEALDFYPNAMLSFKVIGHQWYWSYEYQCLVFKHEPINCDLSSWLDIFEDRLNPFLKLFSTDQDQEIALDAVDNVDNDLLTVDAIYSLFLSENNIYINDDLKINLRDVSFDSYMLDEQQVSLVGGLRNLEVDNPLYVPIQVGLRFLITSVDVLHSWAVPSLGLKIDAVPGRLTQIAFILNRSGEFYGQCSEICGINHGFMPIKVIGLTNYSLWTSKYN